MQQAKLRSTSLDDSSHLWALPSTGNIWARMKLALSNWVQSSMAADAESRFWSVAQSDPRIMAELVQGRVRPEAPEMAQPPLVSPLVGGRWAPLAESKPLNGGWGSILAHAYQTRLYTSANQVA